MNLANVTNLARNIWKDLVERRLWPIALVLVIALVAIPVVLAKPAPQVPVAPTAVASDAGPEPLVASAASIRSNTGGALVGGKFKDPFHQLHVVSQAATSAAAVAKGPATSDASSSAGGGSGDSSGSGGGSGGSGGGSGGSGGGSGGGPSAQDTGTKLKIEFGLAGGKRTVREISPGTPLPASSNPLIVFLGFGKDGTRPVFLVSSDVVKTEGEGTCKPSKSVCSELTLAVGEAQFFDAQNGDQYQLDVLGVVKH
jgi:hypothetical protein